MRSKWIGGLAALSLSAALAGGAWAQHSQYDSRYASLLPMPEIAVQPTSYQGGPYPASYATQPATTSGPAVYAPSTPLYGAPPQANAAANRSAAAYQTARAEPAANPYLDAMSTPWTNDWIGPNDQKASYGKGGKGDCGDCANWFFGIGGLIMDRNDENKQFFSYDDDDESIQLLSSREAGMPWSGGFEVRGGRFFCCGEYAVEAVYWGVFPSVQEARLQSDDLVGSLNTTYDLTRLNDRLGGGAISVNEYFDNAVEHRLRRSYEFHNVEINFLHSPYYLNMDYCGMASPGWNLSWGLGIRYFQFSEGFEFATVSSLAGNPEMAWQIKCNNHLVGPQLGFRADYCLTRRLHFHAGTKVGVFGNHIEHRQRIVGPYGAAVVGAGPNAGRAYDVDSTEDEFAFLAELDFGLHWQIAQRWRIIGGYRVAAISGVALPTEQIPYNVAGIDDVIDIDNNGDLILHGAYAGVEFTW